MRQLSRAILTLLVSTIILTACESGGGGSTTKWTGTKQLGVAGKNARATGVSVDSSDKVYVTGYTDGGLDGNTLSGTYDFFLTKNDSSGNKVYTK